MSKPDTSRAAVELRAQQHDGTSAIFPGRLRAWYCETADLLRALVDERDEARQHVESERGVARIFLTQRAALLTQRAALEAELRAASLDRLAANDAPLLDAEAAFAAGAEAMRDRLREALEHARRAMTRCEPWDRKQHADAFDVVCAALKETPHD
jgi:predicted signal transduction protein with EAL and GGDEF domain